MATTTIRVSISTRDRLNELTGQISPNATVDDAVQYLLDHHWEMLCIEQADRHREEDPGQWSSDIRMAGVLNALLNPDEPVT